jgi:hypothetical protein
MVLPQQHLGASCWLVQEGGAALVTVSSHPQSASGQRKTWWLVPVTAEAELAEIRQVAVQPAGSVLHCPPTGRQACGRFWLSRPDGSGLLTDPAALATGFSPSSHPRPTEAP